MCGHLVVLAECSHHQIDPWELSAKIFIFCKFPFSFNILWQLIRLWHHSQYFFILYSLQHKVIIKKNTRAQDLRENSPGKICAPVLKMSLKVQNANLELFTLLFPGCEDNNISVSSVARVLKSVCCCVWISLKMFCFWWNDVTVLKAQRRWAEMCDLTETRWLCTV